MSENKTPNCYGVFNCGCTDCFPQAVFVEVAEAHTWAIKNCPNPEGYLISHIFSEIFGDNYTPLPSQTKHFERTTIDYDNI